MNYQHDLGRIADALERIADHRSTHPPEVVTHDPVKDTNPDARWLNGKRVIQIVALGCKGCAFDDSDTACMVSPTEEIATFGRTCAGRQYREVA